MKQRCSFCGGRFGMIRHRHFFEQFCRMACKERYLQGLSDPEPRCDDGTVERRPALLLAPPGGRPQVKRQRAFQDVRRPDR